MSLFKQILLMQKKKHSLNHTDTPRNDVEDTPIVNEFTRPIIKATRSTHITVIMRRRGSSVRED